MYWAEFLLFLSAVYAAGTAYYLLNKTDRLLFVAFFWSAATFLAVTIAKLVDIVTTGPLAEFIIMQVVEWGQVYSITLVLGGLLLFIRESKPEFSRSPRIYAALPIVLIFSYLLVYDISILKWWVLTVAQGGAIAVGLIMYGMYSYYKPIYRTIFAGTVLFLVSFIIVVTLPSSFIVIEQVSLFVSIVIFSSGFLIVDRHFENG